MARLVYLMNVSLDGSVNTPEGIPDFGTGADALPWFTDQMQRTTASVYGRRLYETMAASWPTAEDDPQISDETRAFAQAWNATPKIVFSSTLQSVIPGATLYRTDPVETIQALRDTFEGELAIGGPTIAAPFIARNLIDEYRLVVHPVVIGGGTPALPRLDTPLQLKLIDEQRFSSGVVALTYTRRQP
jgi:dihydrofolate reductase